MSEQTRYLRLTDLDNRGKVIRQVGRKFFEQINGEWKPRGLSMGYFLPEADEYDCYEVISEEEALEIV